MTAAPDDPCGLFAAKGQAMPACSEPLVKRSIPAPSRDLDPRPSRAPRNGQDAPQDASQDCGPASVLSIDLRRVLVPAAQENTARPEISVSQARIPSAQPHGHPVAGPLVAAIEALAGPKGPVAIAIAGGVFLLLNSDRFSVTRVADEPAAADTASTPAEETSLPPAAARAPDANAATPQEAQSPAAQDAGDDAVGGEPQGDGLPSFDLVRVEPDGSAVIAGRAAPYAELVLLHNGEPIGTVKADWAGEWAFVTDRPLPADQHEITLLVNEPDAEITLPQGAEAPPRVSGLGNTRPR